MSIKTGQAAPDFKLHNTEKEAVTLSSQKGKNVVLLFFPAAFTSVCTKELCNFRDNLSRYNDMNAQVFGISVDMPFTLGEFKKQQNLNFPLLSDFNKEAATAYGSIYDSWLMGLKGVAKRSAFVIDKEGNVQYAEVLEDAHNEPDYAKIDAALAGLN
ncbi:MAG: redoxin domain-containing protein [Chitinophagaceae bacterium]